MTKKKILVIDDDPVACDVLSASLSSLGFDVLIVSDPSASLEKARETLPALIFVSLLLPGTNGLKVSKAIHTLDELKTTPVLMMISRAGELDPKYTATIGIVDVLVKPLVSEEVVTKTVEVLGKGTGESPQLSAEDESFDTYAADEDIEGESGQTGEETKDDQEFSYEDEYDSYKETERQNTKKIILLASALFAIILIGIGVFFMKDSLFPSHKAPSLARIEPAAPGSVVSTEPAATLSRTENTMPRTDASSLSAATAGKEVLPQPSSVKSAGEQEKKQPAPVAPPAKQLSRKEKTGPAETVTEPVASGKGKFVVQAGVFENKKNADALSAKLKKKGYKASVLKDQGRNKKPLYRVTIGSHETRSAAVRQSKSLLQKEGIKSVVRQQ